MQKMTEPEFDNLYTTWQQNRTPEGNAAALQALNPTINQAMQTHVGKQDPLLKSKARRMTLRALQTYDPMRGRLRNHVYNHLRGLKRAAGQQAHILRAPERLMLDRRAVGASQQELEDELGREPTDDELAHRAGFSVGRLQRIRGYKPGMSHGFFENLGEGGFLPAVKRQESEAWVQFVYDDLSPIDKKIMEWTLGLNGQPVLANQVIAKRLNRSPGAISQRKKLIQNLLDEEQDLSPFT